MPRITVVIPMFNRADYIGDAIDSVLAQDSADYEIVVVDDGSTDASRERVRAYDNPRIRLVCNDRNRGLSASRNHGIAVARGVYTAFLDSDDRATPDRLRRQAAFLDAHPDHAAVGAWMRWVDAEGRATGQTKRKAVTADQIAAEMLFRSGIEVSAAMARTAILRAYPHRESFVRGSDYDLWARIGADYKLATLPRVLLERRRHAGQSTINKNDPKIKQGRLWVFAEQLGRLGVAYRPADLENHYLLRRMHKADYWPDSAYIAWARRWLTRLQQANRRTRLYPEPQFSAVLALFWLKTCVRGVYGSGPRAAAALVGSRLARALPRALRAEARTRLRVTR